MKHPRGLSLIEVATALAITAILLPVVGVVFYQVLFVPPEQSSRITAADEVQRIATMITQDAYMADNFSVGDGHPYYGNFSWKDYSTGDQFFVSYYYTGNSIARQMTVTPAAPTATPTPPTTMYTLTTSVVGSGSITPASGSSYASGSTVVVTANPATGWNFSSWFGDLSGSNTSTTITMDSNKAITAVFTQNTYTLTTTVAPAGAITAGCTVTTDTANPHAGGSVVQVTANPATRWVFSSWSGAATGSTSPAYITMDSDKAVTATFTQITYNLTTTVAPAGAITAGCTVTTDTANPHASGSDVQVTANPASGWAFVNWSGAATGTTSPASITMNSNNSVTATFAQIVNPTTYTFANTSGKSAAQKYCGVGALPSNPTDICGKDAWAAAVSGDLTNIQSNDGNRWETSITTTLNETNIQRYLINVSEDIPFISRIDVNWLGYGCGNGTKPGMVTATRIYNYNNSSWTVLSSQTEKGADTWFNGSITSSCSNYFYGQQLAVMATAQDDGYTPCPRMYVWDGSEYQFIDSAASGRVLKRYEGTNYPATSALTPKDGYYDLMVRAPAYESSYLDKLGLWAVDHPQGTEIIADDATGTIHTVSEPKTPTAIDSYGSDVTSALSANDGNCWNPDITQKDFSNESQLQDWIELTLPDIPDAGTSGAGTNSGTVKLIVDAHYNYLSLLQLWSYYVYILGSPNHDALVERAETDPEFSPYFDYGFWGCIAFQIEVWNGSDWVHYTDIKITDGASHIALLNLSDIQGDRIRLKVPAGAFAIDYMAVDYTNDIPVTVTELQPVAAFNLVKSPSNTLFTMDVLNEITTEDGSYAILHLGGYINYKFKALDNNPADGMVRSFVIPCTGYYIPEGPEVPEDKSYNWPLMEQLTFEPLAFQKWVYPMYVDWLNNGNAYACNEYDWAYAMDAPFPARETLVTDKHSLDTNYIEVKITRAVTYNLTTSVAGSGTVTPNTSNPHASDSVVLITANASSGYTFTGWSGNLSGSTNPTTIIMNSNKSVTATFALTYNLTTSVVGSGTVTPNTSNPHASGSTVLIIANASSGYTFTGWSGNLSGSTSPAYITMDSDKAVTATFTQDVYYTLNTSVVGSGSIFSNTSNPHASGSTVLVTAVPAAGWTFSSLSGDLSGSSPATITMNSNKSVTATFTQNIYALYTNIVGSGSISTNTSSPYASGATVLVTANPAFGWAFSSWSGALSGSTNPTTIIMTSSKSIIATFLRTAGTYTSLLSWHITSDNFSLALIRTPGSDYIMANMTVSITTSVGKYVEKQLTIYITPRTKPLTPGRGGIWGDDAIIGLGSLTVSGKTNLFNGDLYVNGSVTVSAAENMVAGTLYCGTYSAPADFRCANNGSVYCNPVIPCPPQALPNIGVPQDYFGSHNISTPVYDFGNHQYIFNVSNKDLTSDSQVYNSTTRQLKPGYYYNSGTITLSGNTIRGAVTFIAKQIIINNTTSGSGTGSQYIGLEPYDENNLLLWATGYSGNDIWIKGGATGDMNPCVELEGILYAPYGEVQLDGSGSNPAWWFMTWPATKATIHDGGIMTKDLTITGHDWWFYRW